MVDYQAVIEGPSGARDAPAVVPDTRGRRRSLVSLVTLVELSIYSTCFLVLPSFISFFSYLDKLTLLY